MIKDAALAHVTDCLMEMARERLGRDQFELEVQCLGGDPAIATAWVKYLIATTRLSLERARSVALERLKQGHEIPDMRE